MLFSFLRGGGGCKIYIGCLNWFVLVIIIVLLYLFFIDYYDLVIDLMLVYLLFLVNFEDIDIE